MKEKGVLPRFELQGFNDDIVIANRAPYKMSTKNKPIDTSIHAEIIGKRGEKKLNKVSNVSNVDRYADSRKGRDTGDRT